MADRTWAWGPKLKLVAKVALAALVLAFVGRHVLATRREILSRGGGFRVDPPSFGLAMALYLLGLLAFGAYYWRVMAHSPTPIGFLAATRAYLVSHLAKYVPGKAMVVVARSSLSMEAGARGSTSAFATLYETLTMMSAGGFVAAVGFAIAPGGPVELPVYLDVSSKVDLPPFATVHASWPGLLAGLGLLAIVWPGVFPRLAGLLRKPLRGVGPEALPRLSRGLLAEGLGWSALGWTLLGLSQVAVIRGLGGLGGGLDARLPASAWPAAVASVALAMVAGFAVPIAPGGLGVREWVLWTALASTIDRDRAVVAALALRLAWVAVEAASALVLWPIRPKPRGIDA